MGEVDESKVAGSISIDLLGTNVKLNLRPKKYKKGTKGFYAFGRSAIGSKDYQFNIIVIELGSKPKEANK